MNQTDRQRILELEKSVKLLTTLYNQMVDAIAHVARSTGVQVNVFDPQGNPIDKDGNVVDKEDGLPSTSTPPSSTQH